MRKRSRGVVAMPHAAGVAPGGFDGVVARWAADATGILVLVPLAVTALRRRTGRPRVAGRAGERWIALLLTAASAGVGFGPLWARLPTVLQSPHWMLPPCLWVALRAGVRGAVVVWTDVTRVAAAETERVRLLADLQRTLSEVKVLRGILPICSYCQRIRDEGGGWTRLDQFVAERTQASFSHGVCPDCLRRVLASTGG